MWCLMILNVIALIQSAQGGYDYPKPIIPFELLNEAGSRKQDTGGEIFKVKNIDKTAVSYSLQHDDNQYLQNQEIIQSSQNAIDGADSQSSSITESNSINAQPVLSVNQLILNIDNKVPPLVNLQNNEYTQNVKGNDGFEFLDIQNVPRVLEVQNKVPPLVNLNFNPSIKEHILPQSTRNPDIELHEHSGHAQHNQPSLQNVNNVIKSIEVPLGNLHETEVLNTHNSVQTIPIDLNEQVSNFQDNQIFLPNLNVEQASLNYHHAAVTEELNLRNNQLNSLSLQYLNAANIATPAITKSIYFHVAPPDIKETPLVPAVLPPKKIYKIIFIKAPSYENLYNQQLQTALYNNLVPVEENTIIYVLSKKPEVLPESVVLPQPTKVSEHEVLYVQYKGDKKIGGEDIDSISQVPLNSASDVALEPRVLNGY